MTDSTLTDAQRRALEWCDAEGRKKMVDYAAPFKFVDLNNRYFERDCPCYSVFTLCLTPEGIALRKKVCE